MLLTALLAAVAARADCTVAFDQAAGGDFRFVAGTGMGEVIPTVDRRSAPAVTGALLGGGSWALHAQRG